MAAGPDATVSCGLTALEVDVDSNLDESELATAINEASYGCEKLVS
jgi:hypothetical protein